jgi:hypothetical protein
MDDDKRRNIGYLIAGITLGAAIGNMFLAGKIKNVMNIKVPRNNYYKNNTSKSNEHKNMNNEQGSIKPPKIEETRRLSQLDFPSYMIKDLKNLEIDSNNIKYSAVDVDNQIKQAYRTLAMKYHPDRLSRDDHMIEINTMKFREITDSYNSLNKFIRKQLN